MDRGKGDNPGCGNGPFLCSGWVRNGMEKESEGRGGVWTELAVEVKSSGEEPVLSLVL